MIRSTILEGVLLGLIVAVFIGPVFFALIQTSITKGFSAALFFQLGMLVGDLFCITIIYFGLADVLYHPKFKMYFTKIGGIILLLFGVYAMFGHKIKFYRKRNKITTTAIPKHKTILKSTKSNATYLFVKAFVLNVANPGLIFFWAAWVGYAITRFENQKTHIFTYFTTAMLVIFLTDTLKSFLAQKIKHWFSPQRLLLMNQFLGVIFVIVGIFFIID